MVSGTIVRTDGWGFWQLMVPDTFIHLRTFGTCPTACRMGVQIQKRAWVVEKVMDMGGKFKEV